MPIWLRKFTIRSIQEYFDKEAKAVENANTSKTPKIPKGPNIKPSYRTKARK